MDLTVATFDVFKQIAAANESSGVKLMDGYEYFESPSQEYLELKGRYSLIDGFRVLNETELPPDVKFGVTYRTFSLNPPVYLAWLEQQLISGGVKFVKQDLGSLMEVRTVVTDVDARIIVNCSGVGFSDPNVFPTRGISTKFVFY
jgi:hypothetical protein